MNTRRSTAPSIFRSHGPRILVILALAALGGLLSAWLVPAECRAVARQLVGFPDSDLRTHQARPIVLAGLCFLPALAAFVYTLGGTLDRYVSRQFLGILGVCLSSLFMIWLLIDLSDNVSEFRESDHILATLGMFYGSRLPAILLLLLPYSLLLALLYSLGKLSTNREIIAIIQSGRGIFRVTLPLMIAGIFFTLLSLGINFHWAPIAEGRQDEILAEASGVEATEATQVLYRNPANRRLWMIGAFPADYEKGKALRNVEVTTTDENSRIVSRLSASHAQWNRHDRHWTFQDPLLSRFSPGMPPVFEKPADSLTIDSWSETPWQLIKPGLSAAHLGIPDLSTWLQANAQQISFADPAPYLTQWHYRWALPFTCLLTVLLATPLAIHFSRRGPGGGIFLAVCLSALMLLVSSIVLAFGEAGILRPALAAWLPNLTFALLSAYLFHRRITGRPIYRTLAKLLPSAND
ncbi:MAG: LptF/LptG family permease [Luteolibacter sp.]|jgi:lipopolysaccharide export system permease protein|nr:LptF/LptG family permease [Luteolibacter sp.]